MLYIIGIGLNDEKDITIKGIEALKDCDEVYCEFFTNKWHGDLKAIENMTKKKVMVIDRKIVESDFILEKARTKNVALLVPGDPLAATTHFTLVKEAKDKKISVKIIHSSSIFTAVAETGLHIYKFGRSVTLCTKKKGFAPTSPFDQIKENEKHGLHTLILLDVDQESGNYMTVGEALALLTQHDKKYNKINIVAAACMGSNKQMIKYGLPEKIINEKFGVPAVLIIPGKLHFSEEEALLLWK